MFAKKDATANQIMAESEIERKNHENLCKAKLKILTVLNAEYQRLDDAFIETERLYTAEKKQLKA